MQTPEQINAQAAKWMKRGIALLTENTAQALTDSLSCFDRAIRLRRTLPLSGNAWYRYLLAAGWLNRADALTRLGSPENLTEAVRAYDESLSILQTLDLGANPLFRKRMALAWMNRGVTLQKQGTPEELRAALVSFDSAIGIARINPGDQPVLLAASLTNYGHALFQADTRDLVHSRAAFEEAVLLLSEHEENDSYAAEISIQAHNGFCRVVAWQLAEGTASSREDLVTAATDAVEDALKLARHWQARGQSRFRELALDLVHFGAQAYLKYQPHFVAEFLSEMLAVFPIRDAPNSWEV